MGRRARVSYYSTYRRTDGRTDGVLPHYLPPPRRLAVGVYFHGGKVPEARIVLVPVSVGDPGQDYGTMARRSGSTVYLVVRGSSSLAG